MSYENPPGKCLGFWVLYSLVGSQRQVPGLSRTESFLERQMQDLVMELSKLAGSKTVPTDTAPLGYHCDQGMQSNRRSEKEESLDRIIITSVMFF